MSERLEKFTEGPWVRWKGHASVHATTEATNNDKGSIGRTRGQICECDADDHGDCESQGESIAGANADLIAAAPDLYKALCDILGWVEDMDEIPPRAIKPCKAALKKARGE